MGTFQIDGNHVKIYKIVFKPFFSRVVDKEKSLFQNLYSHDESGFLLSGNLFHKRWKCNHFYRRHEEEIIKNHYKKINCKHVGLSQIPYIDFYKHMLN